MTKRFNIAILLFSLAPLVVLTDHISASEQKFQSGLFWSIAKDGEQIAHIFGTLHTNDVRVTNIPTQIKQAIVNADNFCVETFPGVRYFNPHWGFKSIVDDMMLENDGRLVDLLGKPLYERVEKRLLSNGLKKERVERLKPWAVMHSLSGIHQKKDAKSPSSEILDSVLYELATKNLLNLYQLETLEELMAAYYAFPMPAQVALLEDRLNTIEQIPFVANKMIEIYLEQDLKKMLNLATNFVSPASHAKKYDEVYLKHVLYIRNIVMAHYMLAPLRKKNTFIAMGALHLYGNQGVLSLLEDYGYTVKPVKLVWDK